MYGPPECDISTTKFQLPGFYPDRRGFAIEYQFAKVSFQVFAIANALSQKISRNDGELASATTNAKRHNYSRGTGEFIVAAMLYSP